MGKGIAIEPNTGNLYAPCDGTITVCFPTGHAIGLKSKNGTEILMHVGIDTVNLNGQGFEVLVQEGDKVKAGTPLMKLDLPLLKEKAPSLVSPVICTELEDNQSIRMLHTGEIKAGDELYAIDIAEE